MPLMEHCSSGQLDGIIRLLGGEEGQENTLDCEGFVHALGIILRDLYAIMAEVFGICWTSKCIVILCSMLFCTAILGSSPVDIKDEHAEENKKNLIQKNILPSLKHGFMLFVSDFWNLYRIFFTVYSHLLTNVCGMSTAMVSRLLPLTVGIGLLRCHSWNSGGEASSHRKNMFDRCGGTSLCTWKLLCHTGQSSS
jgi:hypothetical protein